MILFCRARDDDRVQSPVEQMQNLLGHPPGRHRGGVQLPPNYGDDYAFGVDVLLQLIKDALVSTNLILLVRHVSQVGSVRLHHIGLRTSTVVNALRRACLKPMRLEWAAIELPCLLVDVPTSDDS